MDTKQSKSATSKHPDPTDFLGLDELLTQEERAVRDDVCSFVDERIAPNKTNARKDGADWVLNGSKRWIGMGSIADVVVWAQTDDGIWGFLVPIDTPGYTAIDIEHKLSLRASIQSELYSEDLRLPERSRAARGYGAQGAVCLPGRPATGSSGA